MRDKSRPRGRIMLAAVGTYLLVVAVLLGVAAVTVSSTRRMDVRASSLTAIDLTDSKSMSVEKWELVIAERAVDHSRREWQSEDADLLLIEASKHTGPFAAEWFYFAERVKPRYQRQAPGYVEDFEPPETGADRENLFCGNVGHSATDQIEDCQIWGFWARYGQYVVYLEVYGRRMPLADFRELVADFDRHILASFGST